MTAAGPATSVRPAPDPAPAAPPWVLLWLVVYALQLPAAAVFWWETMADLSVVGTYDALTLASPSFQLLRIVTGVQILPSLVVLAGLGAVLLPHVRGRVVERRLGLDRVDRAVVREVEAFLLAEGVDVEVRANLASARGLARVYASGWRQARLALFAPFAKLWRADRGAAHAVLRHELAHVRTGDHLLLGLGSPLVLVVNVWIPLMLLVGVLPILGFIVAGYPSGTELAAQAIVLLFVVPRTLLLPVAAMWSAELAADRYAHESSPDDGLRCLLTRTPEPVVWYRRPVTGRSNPPARLRRWAIDGGPARQVVLLAAWPLSIVALLAVIILGAVPGWLLLGYTGEQVHAALDAGISRFLTDILPMWVPAVLLLAAWPVLAPVWVRWWTRRPAARPAVGRCLMAAAATALLLAILTAVGG